MNNQPLLTIIIAVKNAKEHLLETLNSIRAQTYPRIEIIVIDGNSTDDTQSVIRANLDIITQWRSETDEGISDAFNKGLKLATGDYINFQGAGDTLYSPECLSLLFENHDPAIKLLCGKIVRVKIDGLTPLWIAPKHNKPFNKKSLLFKMSLPHQGLFTHRSFFEQFGNFDKTLKYSMDYELLLRAYHQFPKTAYKNVIVSRWREGGIGANHTLSIFKEYHNIKLKHEITLKWILQLINYFTFSKFYLKKIVSKG